MATATISKTTPTPRRQRPSISARGTLSNGLTGEDGSDGFRASALPPVLTASYILKKHNGKPPSLTVHLHPTFFRFEGQDGNFPYKSDMHIFIDHMKNQTVPHELVDEMLKSSVPFYDGCLIVEVHNHRVADAKAQKRTDTSGSDATTKPFSIHNYNEHVTPSPYVPYPRKTGEPALKKIKTSPEAEESQKDKIANDAMPAPPRNKKPNGPTIYTLVLFPTDLSRHYELLFLASTPAPDAKARKGSKDGTVPPTPTTTTPAATKKQPKMLLEEKDAYNFEADYLLKTEQSLMLSPAKDAAHAQKFLDALEHPLHSHPPPTATSKKRTQADIAADDAQAAREERKMLVMDERVKPSVGGAASGDAQSASASMGFTRFKTLETIKQQHEERIKQRKEEEDRLQLEKRQQQQQEAQRRKLAAAAAEEQQQNLARRSAAEAQHAQQQQAQQQQMLMRQQAMHAQAQAAQQKQMQQQMAMAQAQAQNPQQQALQQAAMNVSSPIIRNQTPMMQSSPMAQNAQMLQGGFPMQNSASQQGVGSPMRPGSAMHPMARQVSQQQHPSRNGTPQMAGATPLMANAMPTDINRQMTATPLMQTGSPARNMNGTPNGAMNNGMANIPTPQMNNGTNLTQAQMMFLNQRRQQAMQMQAQQNASPDQMAMRQQQIARANMNSQNAAQNYQQQLARMQMQNMQMQGNQRVQTVQSQQVMNSPAQMAGEAMIQQASQNSNVPMDQAALAQRQQAMLARNAMQALQNHTQQQLARAAAANGGTVPPNVRNQIMAQQQQRLMAHQQQVAMRNQQAAQASQAAQGLGDVNDPEAYMRNLRGQQAMFARMNNNAAANANGAAAGMQANMMANGMQQGQQQQQGQQMGMGRGNMTMQQMQAYNAMRQAQQMNNDPLSQHFGAMQNALNRQHAQQGQGQGM